MKEMIGTRLSNRYEILHELGQGGMGVVYLAHDPLLDREVAVKLINPAALNEESKERFKREARIIARMDHPAIVVIYDVGEHEGNLYLVMPYVRGTNLRSMMLDRTLHMADIIHIGISVAEALEYSHGLGVVHRDIKPENIMVVREQEAPLRVRVTDFGLAIDSSNHRITRSGAMVGTIAYLSPEQVFGQNVDYRADLYALGAVLYECLAGETPFTGDVHTVLYRIVNENPQPPSALGVHVGDLLERLLLRCLEKQKERRPQSAREIIETLYTYRTHTKTTDRTVMRPGTSNTYQYERVSMAPLIGRSEEFSELQRRLNDAAAGGECQFVLVGGEPGIGKSRLLDEIEKLARARKVPVLHGRAMEQDKSFPYQGFCEVFQEYFRIRSNTGSSSPADFSDLAQDLAALFPSLTEIGAVDSQALRASGSEANPHTPPGDRTAIFEVLARTVIRIAGGKPLVILLEDLQSAEDSLDALQYIVRRLGSAPVLLAATYRSTEVDKRHPLMRVVNSFQGDRHFSLLTLAPFDQLEHHEFLEKMIGSKDLDGDLVRKLYQASEGNPYFTKELVRSLLDSGRIHQDNKGVTVLTGDAGISSEALPSSIQQIVEKRIQRLSEDLREVLTLASIFGKTFETRDLEIIAENGLELEEAIDQLIAAGFVEQARQSRADRFTFSSGVVRDVLYAEVPRRKRKLLHRAYAEALEKRNAGKLERVYPQLVHHYSSGDVPGKVVEFGLLYAKKSLDAFSAEEAIRSVKTVLEFLEEENEAKQSIEGEARSLLGAAYRMEGDIDAALAEWERSIKLFERERQSARTATTLLAAAETAWAGRKVEKTAALVERGIEWARSTADKGTLSRLLSLGAMVANLSGDYRQAKEYLDESEKLTPAEHTQEETPHGGNLVVPFPIPLRPSHPVLVQLDEEVEIAANIFEPLLTSDAQGNLVPGLCEHCEMQEGGRVFLISLRENVRFHNGQTLGAAEVQRSFERAMRINPQNLPPAFAEILGVTEFLEGRAGAVQGISPLSERMLRIELSESIPVYPALLTDVRAGIVFEENHAYHGTGPFKMCSFQENRLVLERNPFYWKGNATFVDSLEFRGGVHAAEIAAGFRAGEFDLVRDLLPEDMDEIFRHRRNRAILVEAPKKNTYFVLLKSSNPIFSIPEVRRAITGVIRTHDLVHRTLGRFAQPAEGLLPPGILGHDPERRRHAISREEATDLLKSVSEPRPLSLKASIHPVFLDRCLPLTNALFQIWKEIGIEISNVTPDITSYIDRWQHNEDVDLILGRWVADYDDPDSFAHVLFSSTAGIMRRYYSSLEMDLLIQEARAERSPAARERMYRKLETFLLDTGCFLPLFHDIDYRIANRNVKHLRLRSSPPYVNYSEVAKGEQTAAPPLRKQTGGTINIPATSAIHSLDPSLMFTSMTSEIVPNVFESLTREQGLQIKPWLVSELRSEEGGKRYRYRLRDSIRFHDGRPMSSRDVRYSLERLLQNPNSETRWLLSPIRGANELLNGKVGDLEGFRIQSRTEFTIDLEQPVSFFPALLSLVSTAIVPEGADQFAGSWKDGCIGTGPFRVVRFDPGRLLELEPNPYYWQPGFPKCDTLIFTFAVTPTQILSGFKSGHYALAWELLAADVEALRHDQDFAAHFHEQPRPTIYYAAFNVHKGPLADKEIREPLLRSIDVESLVRRKVGPLGIPSHGLIPPGFIGYDPALRRLPVDSSQPSWTKDVPLKVLLNSAYESRYTPLAEELFRILARRGLEIQIMDTKSEYYSNQPQALANADLLLTRWIGDFPDTDTFMYSLLHSEKGVVGRLCGTREIDALIEKGRRETDRDIRHEIYREIETIIEREALLLPLFYEQSYCFVRPEIEGLEMNYFSPVIACEKLWVRR